MSESPEIARRVEAEMTRLLYRSAGFGLFSNVALGAVLVAGTLNLHAPRVHAAWLGTLLVVSGLRWGLNLAFQRRDPQGAHLQSWRYYFLLGVAVSGLVWGAAGWWYFNSASVMPRTLLIFILAGLNAGAARSLASVPASYRIYVFATLAPLLLRFVTLDETGSWTMAFITVTYALFLLNTAKLHYADLRQLWRLIFENEMLVGNLSHAKEVAEASSRAKSDFLATMSHEIRTPMNGILGMLQILEHSSLTKTQKAQVDIAMGSADTLMRLLNDILDLSKIESGKLEFEHLPFPLAPTISGVVELLRSRAEEKRLDLQLNLATDLPAYVVGDAVRLKQVLLNLTGNAVKFTERGRVVIAAREVRRTPEAATVRFEISDTGIGMDRATQERLFQLFSQADNSMTRRFGGSGLGLAISQRLVTRMGGKIVVESEAGRGSTFSFEITLPIGSAPIGGGPASSASANDAFAGRVLVVEDDRVNQRVVQLLLEKYGLECLVVGDGQAAVEAVVNQSWDLVLMDCQMPGMDGFEATRRIRNRLVGRPLAIVALTANAMQGDREACLAAGMDDFLAKPIRQPELKACLEKWLRPGAT